jgi:hypothetical protein
MAVGAHGALPVAIKRLLWRIDRRRAASLILLSPLKSGVR